MPKLIRSVLISVLLLITFFIQPACAFLGSPPPISPVPFNYGSRYEYNANSNRTKLIYPDASHITYDYDALNRLTAIKDQAGANIASYQYDALSRRKQLNYANNTGASYEYDNINRLTKIKGLSPQGTVPDTTYLYDGDQIIAEYDLSGALQTKYIYGPGIDEPVLITKGEQSYYYHFDGLGSVTSLTDATGTTAESYSYDAFGTPSATSTLGNRYMFTGREYDPETGLYFYRARYYSPELGRFLQRDPVGYIAGLNLYSYCSNNPINWIDPFGWDKQGNKGDFPGGNMNPDSVGPKDPRPEDPTPDEPGLEEQWLPPILIGVGVVAVGHAGTPLLAGATVVSMGVGRWILVKAIPVLVTIQTILSPINDSIKLSPGAGTAIKLFMERNAPIVEIIKSAATTKAFP